MVRLLMTNFVPRLDILPAAQRRLWTELNEVPPEFVLYGGTAIALHLGHRESVDFDFFGSEAFDPSKLQPKMSFMANAQITQRGPNTLTGSVDRDGLVKVFFLVSQTSGIFVRPTSRRTMAQSGVIAGSCGNKGFRRAGTRRSQGLH